MSVDPADKTPKFSLRSIFMNILITVFIIMSYIYISEIFGSISTPYIGINEFSIIFGLLLLIYTFFSIIAGPIQAFIAGFLGELLYQFAFYNNIYLDWCLIVAIYGLIAGLYKYKPLKYHKGMAVYYTFLLLVINSFLVMFLIIVFQLSLYSSPLELETIFINFGFKFFLQTLISTIFLIPILLIIYDKILASKERHLYYLLLTHHPVEASDHTFYFQFGRTKIYVCSRCSGMIIGIIMSVFFTHLTELIINAQFSAEIALLIIIFFPIPGMIDWGTQKLLFRKSTTESRLLTGFIIGVALHFMSFTKPYYFLTLIIVTIYFVILFLLIFFGQKKLFRELKKELNPLSPEDLDNDQDK